MAYRRACCKVMSGRFILIGIVVAILLSACGDDSGDAPEAAATQTPDATKRKPTPTAQPQRPDRPTPLGCLGKAGLDGTEQRGPALWRGYDPVDGTIVVVERYGSRAEALEVVRMATAVHADVAGRYAVTGALKKSTSEVNVANVAACLSE